MTFGLNAQALANATAPVVLVAPIKVARVDPADGVTITEIVRAALVQTKRFRVVAPEEMAAIDKELERQLSGGCDDASCVQELGGALGAQFIVTGSLGRLGRHYTLTLKFIDVETNEARGAASGSTRQLEDFLKKLPGMVASLSPVPTKPVAKQAPPTAKAPAQLKVHRATASSTLKARHAPTMAFDGNPTTAWAEGVRGSGKGEWLELELAAPHQIARLAISTGFDARHKKLGDLFGLNAQLRAVAIVFDGKKTLRRTIKKGQRLLVLDGLNQRARRVRIIAERTWPGSRWQDLAISEVRIEGR